MHVCACEGSTNGLLGSTVISSRQCVLLQCWCWDILEYDVINVGFLSPLYGLVGRLPSSSACVRPLEI